MLNLKQFLVEVSVLVISEIDGVDVVLVLETEVVEGPLQVFDICRRLATHMVQLVSEAICLTVRVGSSLRLLL